MEGWIRNPREAERCCSTPCPELPGALGLFHLHCGSTLHHETAVCLRALDRLCCQLWDEMSLHFQSMGEVQALASDGACWLSYSKSPSCPFLPVRLLPSFPEPSSRTPFSSCLCLLWWCTTDLQVWLLKSGNGWLAKVVRRRQLVLTPPPSRSPPTSIQKIVLEHCNLRQCHCLKGEAK